VLRNENGQPLILLVENDLFSGGGIFAF